MYLLIDIGNTKTKWMLRDKKSIHAKGVFFSDDIDQHHFDFDDAMTKILISNVAGFEKEAILKIKLKKFSCPIEFIKPQKTTQHLMNHYDDYAQLGVDRYVSAVFVSKTFQKSVVLASLGTAVTIDLVTYNEKDKKHTFEGGVILPGLYLTKKSLSQHTNNIDIDEGLFQMPPRNTQNAITSGFILNIIHHIKSCVDIATSKKLEVSIVLSGGDAAFIYPHLITHGDDLILKNNMTIHEDLVLEGLFVLAEG